MFENQGFIWRFSPTPLIIIHLILLGLLFLALLWKFCVRNTGRSTTTFSANKKKGAPRDAEDPHSPAKRDSSSRKVQKKYVARLHTPDAVSDEQIVHDHEHVVESLQRKQATAQEIQTELDTKTVDIFFQAGYRSHFIGSFVKFLLVVYTAVVHVLMWCLVLAYYFPVEMEWVTLNIFNFSFCRTVYYDADWTKWKTAEGKIEDWCTEATQPTSGGERWLQLGVVTFLGVWPANAFCCIFYALYSNAVTRFFLNPVPLDEAEVVYVESGKIPVVNFLHYMSRYNDDEAEGEEYLYFAPPPSSIATKILEVRDAPAVSTEKSGKKYIEFECVRYMLASGKGGTGDFCAAENPVCTLDCAQMLDFYQKTLPSHDVMAEKTNPAFFQNGKRRQTLLQSLGKNEIEVPVDPLHMFVIAEFFRPMYICCWFTMMTVAFYFYWQVWLFQWLLTLVAGLASAYMAWAGRCNIKELAKSKAKVNRLDVELSGNMQRKESVKQVMSDELCPGDVVEVYAGDVMSCDCVLLEGQVVMQEANLTGEPMPIQKFCIPNDGGMKVTRLKHGKKHFLYNGTDVMQAKGEGGRSAAIVLVVHTGPTTQRGDLLRSILFQSGGGLNFEFTQTLWIAYPFFCFLGLIMCAGPFVDCISKGTFQQSLATNIMELGNVISYIASPMIIVGFNWSQQSSANRLKTGKYKVQCLDLQRLLMAGKLKIQCFDKTGTLTEDTLDFYGCRKMQKIWDRRTAPEFATMLVTPDALSSSQGSQPMQAIKKKRVDKDFDLFDVGMAACHTVTKLESEGGDFEYIGNALECEMVTHMIETHDVDFNISERNRKHTDFHYKKDNKEPVRAEDVLFTTVVSFEFDQHIQLQSVIVDMGKHLGRLFPALDPMGKKKTVDVYKFMLFTKGSFEMVQGKCKPETIPENYEAITRQLASEGFYVLALAAKPLPNVRDIREIGSRRADLEHSLDFLGLLLFKNEVKPDSAAAVEVLKEGGIKPLIITGDNVCTGLKIAETVGIVNHKRMTVFTADCKLNNKTGEPELFWTIQLSDEDEATLLRKTKHQMQEIEMPELDDEYMNEKFETMSLETDASECYFPARAKKKNGVPSTVPPPPESGAADDGGSGSQDHRGSRLRKRGSMFSESSMHPDQNDFVVPGMGEQEEVADEQIREHDGATQDDELPAEFILQKYFEATRGQQDGTGTSPPQARDSNPVGRSSRISTHNIRISQTSRRKSGGSVSGQKQRSLSHEEYMQFEEQAPLLKKQSANSGYGAASPSVDILQDLNLSHPFFALTQKGFTFLEERNPKMLDQIFARVLVFGRMTPQGKIDVIERWQKKGYVVGMCGDGGNDCGALRAAHVGLALSEGDASIVAPFSSSARSVGACVEIVKEGRCALQNCVSCFKFQVSVSLLHGWNKIISSMYDTYMSEVTFFFKDIVAFPFIGVWALSSLLPVAENSLTRSQPSSNLLGFQTLCNMAIYLFTHDLFIFIVFGSYLTAGPWSWWYERHVDVEETQVQGCYSKATHYAGEVLSIWSIMASCLAGILFAYSGGHGRLPVYHYRHWRLFVALILSLGTFVFAVFSDGHNAVSSAMRINTDENLSYEYAFKGFDILTYWLDSSGRKIYNTRAWFKERVNDDTEDFGEAGREDPNRPGELLPAEESAHWSFPDDTFDTVYQNWGADASGVITPEIWQSNEENGKFKRMEAFRRAWFASQLIQPGEKRLGERLKELGIAGAQMKVNVLTDAEAAVIEIGLPSEMTIPQGEDEDVYKGFVAQSLCAQTWKYVPTGKNVNAFSSRRFMCHWVAVSSNKIYLIPRYGVTLDDQKAETTYPLGLESERFYWYTGYNPLKDARKSGVFRFDKSQTGGFRLYYVVRSNVLGEGPVNSNVNTPGYYAPKDENIFFVTKFAGCMVGLFLLNSVTWYVIKVFVDGYNARYKSDKDSALKKWL